MSGNLSELLLLLKALLSPIQIGILHTDSQVCRDHIRKLKDYITAHKGELSNLQDDTGTDCMKMFYCVYEIVDYFGIQRTSKEIQMETYLFTMEFISIFGIFKKYNIINTSGTEIFYFHINLLDDKYLLYTDLLPNLISKSSEVCSLKSNSDTMSFIMSVCKSVSAATRIIVNHERQLIKDMQTEQFVQAIDQVLICCIEFLEKVEPGSISNGFKNMISELIYRVELSSNLLAHLKQRLQKLVPFIQPIERKVQIGRTNLRVAVVSAEMDLRKILLALRCFQFSKVVELSEIMQLRLEVNSFYTSDHAGSGPVCFTGFSEIFNILVDKVLLIFENLSSWSHDGYVEVAKIILDVFDKFFSIPKNRSWDGPWIALNDRTNNLVNTLANLKNSTTV